MALRMPEGAGRLSIGSTPLPRVRGTTYPYIDCNFGGKNFPEVDLRMSAFDPNEHSENHLPDGVVCNLSSHEIHLISFILTKLNIVTKFFL